MSATTTTLIFDVARVLFEFKEKRPEAAHNYERLRSQLEKPQDLSTEVLAKYLRGFRQCVTELTTDHEVLVGVVIKVDWTTRGCAVAKEYHSLVTSLISTQTVYLNACLEAVVDQLSLYARSKDKTKFRKPNVVVVYDVDARLAHQLTFSYVHNLILAIVRIVPMSPNILCSHAKYYFPFIKLDGYIIECYVQNLLRMSTYLPSTYLPSIRADILLLIFENLVKIDLTAPYEQVLREEMSCVELLLDEDVFDSSSTEVTTAAPRSMIRHRDGKKMDDIMYVVFSYIKGVCHHPQTGELDWDVARALYQDLLVVFDKIILPTHASNYIQFTIFYVCSFRASLAEKFLRYLWNKTADRNESKVFRQNASTYISDYLSRAKYVDITSVRTYLKIMCEWVHEYINQTARTLTKPDLVHHETFYAVCQAIFNVVVARQSELLKTIEDVKFFNGLDLRTIVYCRLNPLNVCAPIVADKFASVTRAKQLVYCDAIIQQNRRRTLPEVGRSDERGGDICATHLKNLTPFNEYILTLSGRFIEGLYRESDYKDLSGEEEVSGGVEEVDMVDEETELYGRDMEGNYSGTTGVGNNSFGAERSYMELHMHGRSP